MPVRALTRWWSRLRAQREAAAVARRAIPDDLWKRTLVRYPFLRLRQPEAAAELRRMTSLVLDKKEFSTTGGLKLTDAMAVAIAAQAALPILKLGIGAYDRFVGIIVHPDAMLARRSATDEAGVVHEYEEVLSGEAMDGGPVVLSWPDVRAAGFGEQTYNVVIHEFAHVLDMANGTADGVPPLPSGVSGQAWLDALDDALASLRRDIEAELDPLIDPYAAEGREEFFAVSSEVFFANGAELQAAYPGWYAMLTRYYLQDPAAESPPLKRR